MKVLVVSAALKNICWINTWFVCKWQSDCIVVGKRCDSGPGTFCLCTILVLSVMHAFMLKKSIFLTFQTGYYLTCLSEILVL